MSIVDRRQTDDNKDAGVLAYQNSSLSTTCSGELKSRVNMVLHIPEIKVVFMQI